MSDTSRRERQLEALRELCRCGAATRAVDLAFEHFAAFGRNEEIILLLAETIAKAPDAEADRRFAELQVSVN